MDAIRILCRRNRQRRLVARFLRVDRLRFTYRPDRRQPGCAALTDKLFNRLKQSAAREAVKLSAPNRKRVHIVEGELGGAALTEKLSKSQRPRPEREAINVIAPEKKLSRIAASVAGSALTEKLFSSPKRMLGRDARNVTDPKKKRARIVRERQERPVGAASAERSSRPPRPIAGRGKANATVPEERRASIVAEQRKRQHRLRRRIGRIRHQHPNRRRDQHPVVMVTRTTSRTRFRRRRKDIHRLDAQPRRQDPARLSADTLPALAPPPELLEQDCYQTETPTEISRIEFGNRRVGERPEGYGLRTERRIAVRPFEGKLCDMPIKSNVDRSLA